MSLLLNSLTPVLAQAADAAQTAASAVATQDILCALGQRPERVYL